MHGSEDRAKDASPGACDDLSCLRRVHAHRSRMPTAFPSSASSGHPLSSARLAPREDYPRPESDRPRPSFRPRPAKSAAFLKTGMPFTATTREGIWSREGIAPSGLRAGSLAHAAHTFSPNWGECFGWALQGHGAVTRSAVTIREYRRLCNSLELPRLGLTTQARHRARPTRPSTRADCLARTDAGRSA